MRGSRKRKGGWVPGGGVPQLPKAEGMLLSRLWVGVHATGRASWSIRLWVCDSGAIQSEWDFEDVVQGLLTSLG